MTKPNKRGRQGEGGGRPKLPETLQRVTVSLTPTQIEWLRTKGNLSEVIRTIVEKEQNATS